MTECSVSRLYYKHHTSTQTTPTNTAHSMNKQRCPATTPPVLDAVRGTTVSGDRQSTLPLRTCAAFSLSFCSFIELTAAASLELTAKSVRPREKSFISAISRFQNGAQKKNMNDVRGQEMSKNTLLSFLIFAKFSFLRFAEKLRGGWKKWPTS